MFITGFYYIIIMYDKHILQILSEVGDKGISVQNLAKHVYNCYCGLFSVTDISEVHKYVQAYLLKNSKSPSSLIVSTGRRGYYRLNDKNNDAQQLMLSFKDMQADELAEQEKPQVDLSLNLFD